jgi:hypothetical protein
MFKTGSGLQKMETLEQSFFGKYIAVINKTVSLIKAGPQRNFKGTD